MRGASGRPWARRPLPVALDVLVVLLVGCYFVTDLGLDRTDAIGHHPNRPTDGPGQDWLLAGSDGAARGRRIETLYLLHIPHAHDRPTLIGLPRITYAPVQGHGRGTFEAAYALGGPRLLVSSVETGTGVRIDRYLEFAARGRSAAPLLMDTVRSVTVDDGDHVHHLIQLAMALREVAGGGAVTTTLPIGRRGSIAGVGPVALIDDVKIRLLAVAIAGDRPLPASLLTT